MYVSLEPCNHVGRTPACTEALIEAGVARVVAAIEDPNPEVAGGGAARLREANIDVQVGVLAGVANRQNEAFFTHMRTALPFVTLKMAASLDGRTAARDGSNRWITSDGARAQVQRLRASADAVLVGAGTAIADDPQLTVRLDGYRGEPIIRIVADAVGRVEPTGHLFDRSAPTIIATTDRSSAQRQDAWAAAGAEVLVCDPAGHGDRDRDRDSDSDRDSDGGLALGDLLTKLGKRDIQSLLVEGGPTLAGAMVREGLVDKTVFFFAPSLIGGNQAPGILGGMGAGTLGESLPLDITEVSMIGPDLKVEAYVQRNH